METAMTYTILIEKNERGDGWAALAPDLPGLLLIGATREALLDDAAAAIADYLDALRAEGLPIPEPSMHELAMITVT
jgi:predicted RNase H-like HicB family nuclease